MKLAPYYIFFIISFFSLYSTGVEITLKPRALPARWNECQNCHRTKTYEFIPKSKKLTLEHIHIQITHGKKEMSCNYCHNKNNHNFLIQSVGNNDFTKSELVCQTCHSDVYKKWTSGSHGKRIQSWNQQVQYNCIDCHDPHHVSFPKMKAVPPPPFPKYGIPKKAEHHL